MKFITSVLLTLVLSFTTATQTKADDFDILAVTLCELAKTDGRSTMRKKIRAAKVKLRSIYEGITCAGDDKFKGGSLLRMATAHGSLDAANYLATKAGKKALKMKEHDGKDIIEWTQARVDSGKAGQEFLDLYQSKI